MTSKLDKILCIDDDPDILAITQIALEVLGGYTLRTCTGGDEGIRQSADWQPDLIICDVMMPELDGMATLKLLRENRSTAQIPLVFLTARVEKAEMEEYRRLGADGVIEKPFDVEALPNEVQNVWKQLAAHA